MSHCYILFPLAFSHWLPLACSPLFSLAHFLPIGLLQVTADDEGRLVDERGKTLGVLRRLATPGDVAAAEREAGQEGIVVVDPLDWQASPNKGTRICLQPGSPHQQDLGCSGGLLGACWWWEGVGMLASQCQGVGGQGTPRFAGQG
jgi:hypothetical protein